MAERMRVTSDMQESIPPTAADRNPQAARRYARHRQRPVSRQSRSCITSHVWVGVLGPIAGLFLYTPPVDVNVVTPRLEFGGTYCVVGPTVVKRVAVEAEDRLAGAPL